MNSGSILKQLREQNNLTLEEVGKKVGVGKSTVLKWETGAIKSMRRDKIGALAELYGVSPTFIVELENKTLIDIPRSPTIYSTVPEAVNDPKPVSPEYFIPYVEKLSPEEKAELFTRLFQQMDKDSLLRLGALMLQIASTKE